MGFTKIEEYAQRAYELLKSGRRNEAYSACLSCYNALRNNPEQLRDITDYERTGVVLVSIFSYNTIHDVDIQQRIASVAFLLLSKGIEKNPSSYSMRGVRFVIMNNLKESFKYTVASILDSNPFNPMSMYVSQSSTEVLNKMVFYEIESCPKLIILDPNIARRKKELEEMISTGALGGNRFAQQYSTPMKISEEGRVYMSKLISYLEEKIFVNEDIDFD